MKFESIDIGTFANATNGDGGPAESLLEAYSRKNGKTHQVFEYLHRMRYYVGMQIIKKYGEWNTEEFFHIYSNRASMMNGDLISMLFGIVVDEGEWWRLPDDEDDSETMSDVQNRYRPSAPPQVSR